MRVTTDSVSQGNVRGGRPPSTAGVAGHSRRKAFARHDSLQVRLGPTQHRHGSQDLFDETRVGPDRLAFAVADRAKLDGRPPGWHALPSFTSRLCQPTRSCATVLVLRDPDNIQLEFFVDRTEPASDHAGAADDR